MPASVVRTGIVTAPPAIVVPAGGVKMKSAAFQAGIARLGAAEAVTTPTRAAEVAAGAAAARGEAGPDRRAQHGLVGVRVGEVDAVVDRVGRRRGERRGERAEHQ